MAHHFQDLDANEDGMIDEDEFAKAEKMFTMTNTEMSRALLKHQGFMARSTQ